MRHREKGIPPEVYEEFPDWPNKTKKPTLAVKVKRPSSYSKCLKINLENCKYDIVREVAEKLNFQEVKEENEPWDLYWTDLSVSVERVSKMVSYQSINHFPGMLDICRKASLARYLRKMQERFPDEFNFFPPSWSVPADVEEWRAGVRKRAATGAAPITYIVKPDAGAMGRGIYLIQKEEDLESGLGQPEFNGWVIQGYIQRPLLIDGFKFDLRLYVLITSVDPLRIYLLDEGLARFATAPYAAPNEDNLATRNMHLTNYSVNKQSNKYVYAETDPNSGSKRRLTAVLALLEEQGHDTDSLMRRIEDLVIKTVLPIEPHLAHTYYMACSRLHTQGKKGHGTGKAAGSTGSRCFELLGFDVLLDQYLQPWLMEVNHSPSFGTDTRLDHLIKGAAIQDAIQAQGLSVRAREKVMSAQRREMRARLYGPAVYGTHQGVPLGAPTPGVHSRGVRHRLSSRLRRDDRSPSPNSRSPELSDSDAVDEEEELRRPPPAQLGGFRCIYPLMGNGERLASVAEAINADWEARSECVCERCTRRHYRNMAQDAMATFHSSALQLASERERARSALYTSPSSSSSSTATATGAGGAGGHRPSTGMGREATGDYTSGGRKVGGERTRRRAKKDSASFGEVGYNVGTLAWALGHRRPGARREHQGNDVVRSSRDKELGEKFNQDGNNAAERKAVSSPSRREAVSQALCPVPPSPPASSTPSSLPNATTLHPTLQDTALREATLRDAQQLLKQEVQGAGISPVNSTRDIQRLRSGRKLANANQAIPKPPRPTSSSNLNEEDMTSAISKLKSRHAVGNGSTPFGVKRISNT